MLGLGEGSRADGFKILVHDSWLNLGRFTHSSQGIYLLLLAHNRGVATFGGQSKFVGQRCEAEIGIVLAQQNAVFGTGGKHTVGLINSFINKVVNKNANVCLVSAKHQRLAIRKPQMGIDTGHNSLRRSFLITGGTINLTSQEEVFYNLGTQGIVQVLRIEIIVFYSVCRFEYNSVFEALYGMHGL